MDTPKETRTSISSAGRAYFRPQTDATSRRPRHLGILAAALLTSLLALALAPPKAAVPASGPEASTAAKGKKKDKRDFGDAPDGAPAGYAGLPNVAGSFPAQKKSRGASHRKVGKLLLGAKVTAEGDSRQVDRDRHDDGFSVILRECQRAAFHFVVDASDLPGKVLRRRNAFLNVWGDWNRDGDWRDRASCRRNGDTPEWVIENRRLKLRSFIKDPIQTITVEALAGASGPHLWMRASVSDKPFAKTVKVGGTRIRNDGRGTFRFGETEDYFVHVDGPVEDVPELEHASCDPPTQAANHHQSRVFLFSIVDADGNPVNVADIKVLTQNLPAGWFVLPNAPGGPLASATVGYKEDPPERDQRATLSFLVESATTGFRYQVSCELEVRHLKKKQLPKGDFGDAPDFFRTVGTRFEPLCKNSIFSFFCMYPSKAPGGPVHRMPRPIHLGELVTSERDSKQVDADQGDESAFLGFPRGEGCTQVVFLWNVVVENPKDKRFQGKRNRQERRALEKLIRQIRTGRAKIFLNAWFDTENTGIWDFSECGGRRLPDHAVSDSRLTEEELERLSRPRPSSEGERDGKRRITIARTGLVGPIALEGEGCQRGTISVDQRFHPGVSGSSSHDTGGAVLHSYRLGETVDICPISGDGPPGEPPPPPGTPDDGTPPPDGTPAPACSDAKDNDGDGLVDFGDPGCLSGPGGAYDPDDQSEVDLTGTLPCPASGEPVFTGVLSNAGSTLIRHLVRIAGIVRMERVSGDPDFDSGTAGPFDLTCSDGTQVRIHIAWTRPEPMKIKYDFFVQHLSGPGGDSIDKSATGSAR